MKSVCLSSLLGLSFALPAAAAEVVIAILLVVTPCHIGDGNTLKQRVERPI